MPVLTPADAAKILERMKTTPKGRCELCGTPLDTSALMIGQYPVWMCQVCRDRHERVTQRRRDDV